jgi:hypothetical protein
MILCLILVSMIYHSPSNLHFALSSVCAVATRLTLRKVFGRVMLMRQRLRYMLVDAIFQHGVYVSRSTSVFRVI